MKMMETPAEKAKVTTAIRAYLDAKNAEKAAKAEAEKRKVELLSVLDGDKEANWNTDDGRKYHIVATYGKCISNLNADLIRQVLGVEVTPECYKPSRAWDEIKITILA